MSIKLVKKVFFILFLLILVSLIFIVMSRSDNRPLYLYFFNNKNISIEEKLTEGTWTKVIGSEGFKEAWEYKFSKNHQFTNQFYTDYQVPLAKGEWQIRNENNKDRLIITSNENDGCSWISCTDAIYIEYDPIADQMLITGPYIVGVQKLNHKK